MNCCWLIILLFLCGGNGFGGGCGSNCGCDSDCGREERRRCDEDVRNVPPSRGCNDDLIQPRGFAGFSGSGTCGCEDKND